ncbi:MAG: tape measure protein, partial [Gammaproteobacteria bacterium]|nr:tape measure protein [Gammaproteobacteria bacterium]
MSTKEIGSLAINLLANTAKFTKEMERANKKLDSFGAQAKSAAKIAAGAFAGISVARMAGDVIKAADTMSLLESKIRLVSKSNEEAAIRQSAVFESAQRTRSEYEATVTLYSRMARATDTLNLSQAKQLQLTETINKAIKVSGATNTEAEAAVTQLSQGLAAGALRGEELNSVMEQTPRLAQAIAQGMGLTIGQLREYGKQGKLTAEAVVKALSSQSDAIQREFEKVPVTVGQATTQLENSLLRLSGSLKPVNDLIASSIAGWARLIDKISGAQPGEERFNELFKKRLEYTEALTNGTGRYYTLNKRTLKERIEAIDVELRKLQDTRIETEKLAAVEAQRESARPQKPKEFSRNDAEKQRIKDLSGIESLILKNQSAQEAANDSLLRYNGLWQGGLMSVEAYTEKVRDAAQAFDTSGGQNNRLAEIESEMAGAEERIHQSYANRAQIIETALQNKVITQERYNTLIAQNAARHEEEITAKANAEADKRAKYENRIARLKLQVAQSYADAIYTIGQEAGGKTFKYAQRVSAGITLMSAWQMAAGAAANTQLDFWGRAAVYASALSMGLRAVSQIRSTTIGGGGGGSVGSGPTFPSVNERVTNRHIEKLEEQRAMQGSQGSGKQLTVNLNMNGNWIANQDMKEYFKEVFTDLVDSDHINITVLGEKARVTT